MTWKPKDAAAEYASAGVHVLCLKPQHKHPVKIDERPYGDGTYIADIECSANPKVVQDWYSETPNGNVGIATGSLSGVFVLDVDGPEGEQSLQQLQSQYGELPQTMEARTGKGRHLYFQAVPNVRSTVSRLADHIDVRGDDGYVVAPPSIHPNGYSYEWANASSPAEAPRWLLDQVVMEPLDDKRPVGLFPGDRRGHG